MVKDYEIYERKVEKTIKKLGPKPSYSQKPSLWPPGTTRAGRGVGMDVLQGDPDSRHQAAFRQVHDV